MEPSDSPRSLTPELIQTLLNDTARADFSSEYVRLMEIYCVVKAGGVAAQIEVAHRLKQSERLALQAEIDALTKQPDAAGRVESLQQEIEEMEQSIANRVAYLQSIDPQEEAHIRSCMPLIDNYFAHLGKSHE